MTAGLPPLYAVKYWTSTKRTGAAEDWQRARSLPAWDQRGLSNPVQHPALDDTGAGTKTGRLYMLVNQ